MKTINAKEKETFYFIVSMFDSEDNPVTGLEDYLFCDIDDTSYGKKVSLIVTADIEPGRYIFKLEEPLELKGGKEYLMDIKVVDPDTGNIKYTETMKLNVIKSVTE